MAGFRLERVSELLREVISEVLRDLKDPRIGFASLTSITVSPDLRHAKIFVSVYGTEQQRKETLIALNNAKGFIRREITPSLSLRHIPELNFVLDTSIEYGVKISELIAKANASSNRNNEHEDTAE